MLTLLPLDVRDSTYVDPQGYWEVDGYGLLSVYKSDWMRFGGKDNQRITSKSTSLDTKDKIILTQFSVSVKCV